MPDHSVRLILPEHGQSNCDYVMIGRRDETAKRNFDTLQADLVEALQKIHQ